MLRSVLALSLSLLSILHAADAAWCEAGSFTGPDMQCVSCPSSGMSIPGQNHGVVSCHCPSGFAIGYEPGKDDWMIQCVNTTVCDGVVDLQTGNCWKHVASDSVAWQQAEDACTLWGGNLASITSLEERTLVGLLYDAFGHAPGDFLWVGAKDVLAGNNDDWRWTDSSEMDTSGSFWESGRPDSSAASSTADCGGARKKSTGSELRIRDLECDGDGVGYLCKKRALCHAGWYWNSTASICGKCPGGGTSIPGANFNVFSCQCPQGSSLTYKAIQSSENPQRRDGETCTLGKWAQCFGTDSNGTPKQLLGCCQDYGDEEWVCYKSNDWYGQCKKSGACADCAILDDPQTSSLQPTPPPPPPPTPPQPLSPVQQENENDIPEVEHLFECVDITVCDGVVDLQTGNCWKHMASDSVAWQQAEDACTLWGGNLASITSLEERTLVGLLYDAFGHAPGDFLWVGAKDVLAGNNDDWRWTDSSEMDTSGSFWESGRPDSSAASSTADCGGIRKMSNAAKIRDLECDGDGVGYLCKKKPICAAGQYWSEQVTRCEHCPSNGTSTPEANLGVYSCVCPEGQALTYRYTVAGEERVECVDETVARCDGVLNALTGLCWKYTRGSPSDGRAGALAACTAWGGSLALVGTGDDLELARLMYEHHGHTGEDVLWVGVEDTLAGEDNDLWALSDGTILEMDATMWEQGRPDKSDRGRTLDCGGLVRQSGAVKLRDIECDAEVEGMLCSRGASCRAGDYWDGETSQCRACPMGGSSVAGRNAGIHGCRCPPGWALGVNLEAGEDGGAVRCIESEVCDGVLDVRSRRCFQFLGGGGGQSWADGEAGCREWGGEKEGHLASIHVGAELELAGLLYDAMGLSGADVVWIGANDIGQDTKWGWADESEKGRCWGSESLNSSLWDVGRPDRSAMSVSKDCGGLWAVHGAARLRDFECSTALGSICSTGPLCENGTYFDIATSTCVACPSGGTSTPAKNYGVWSCQCPPGTTMVFEGEDAGTCVTSTVCDGIRDEASGRCWKHFGGGATEDWAGGEALCRKWGGHLASFKQVAELALAEEVYTSFGNFGEQKLWVGASDAEEETVWEWSDWDVIDFGDRSKKKQGSGNPLFGRGAPDFSALGESKDCAAVSKSSEEGHLEMRDHECESMTTGFLCNTGPRCEPGTFWNRTAAKCATCPAGATSLVDANFGLESCICPDGFALAMDVASGADSADCVLSLCNGILDLSSRRCWKWERKTSAGGWEEAEAECLTWDARGQLASVTTPTDIAVMNNILQAFALNSRQFHWVGANDRAVEQLWQWSDGSEYNIWDNAVQGTQPRVRRTLIGGMPENDSQDRDCGAVSRIRGMTMTSLPCNTNTEEVLGHVCTTGPMCDESGTFWDGESCVLCPSAATSEPGWNQGIYSCQCPNGSAMAINWIVNGSMKLECVESSCDGVLDPTTKTCWKHFAGAPADSWDDVRGTAPSDDFAGREAVCAQWGGSAAISNTSNGLAISGILYDAFGYQRSDRMWVGDLLDTVASCGYISRDQGIAALAAASCTQPGRGRGFLCSKVVNDHYNLDFEAVTVVTGSCPGCWFSVSGRTGALSRKTGVCAPHCHTFNLSNTAIRSVDPAVFDGMHMMRELYLDGNDMAALTLQDFSNPVLGELRVLGLRGSRISSIEPSAFDWLRKLVVLDLGFNLLSTFALELWDPLTSLEECSLSNNALQCLPVFQPAIRYVNYRRVPFVSQLPLCLPNGCPARFTAAMPGIMSASDKEWDSTSVGFAFYVMEKTLEMIRAPEAAGLDFANLASGMYLDKGEGVRCWCDGSRRCFNLLDPSKEALFPMRSGPRLPDPESVHDGHGSQFVEEPPEQLQATAGESEMEGVAGWIWAVIALSSALAAGCIVWVAHKLLREGGSGYTSFVGTEHAKQRAMLHAEARLGHRGSAVGRTESRGSVASSVVPMIEAQVGHQADHGHMGRTTSDPPSFNPSLEPTVESGHPQPKGGRRSVLELPFTPMKELAPLHARAMRESFQRKKEKGEIEQMQDQEAGLRLEDVFKV